MVASKNAWLRDRPRERMSKDEKYPFLGVDAEMRLEIEPDLDLDTAVPPEGQTRERNVKGDSGVEQGSFLVQADDHRQAVIAIEDYVELAVAKRRVEGRTRVGMSREIEAIRAEDVREGLV